MTRTRTAPVRAAGVALGMGLGGLFDGIVFHQILQVHNMLSARIPTDTLVGAKVNMAWDGFFHAAVWLLTVLGIALLWRAASRDDTVRSTRYLLGAMLLGWGAFNVIEGVIDHHVLHLHHVVEAAGVSAWDALFLCWGAAMGVVGVVLMRRGARTTARGPG